MLNIDAIRNDLVRLRRRSPFKTFLIVLDNGERVLVKHPESIAFDPVENGRQRLFILDDKHSHNTSLFEVASILELDHAESSGI